MIEFVFHEVHIWRHMLEEAIVATAQIVESRLAVRSEGKAVLGTFTVAGEQIAALLALTRKSVILIVAELLLPVAVHHLDESVGAYVAELVLREYEMIA